MNRLFSSSLRRARALALLIATLSVLTLGAAPLWAQDAAKNGAAKNGLDNTLDGSTSGAVSGAVGNAVSNSVGSAVSNTATASTARVGTPSFLSAVDTSLRLWSGQFQKLGIYAMIAVALVASYLTGLILYQLLFGMGGFAPRAASTAAWVGSLVMLLFILLMLPATFPWWAPYALLFGGLLLIAAMVSTLSKKAV